MKRIRRGGRTLQIFNRLRGEVNATKIFLEFFLRVEHGGFFFRGKIFRDGVEYARLKFYVKEKKFLCP